MGIVCMGSLHACLAQISFSLKGKLLRSEASLPAIPLPPLSPPRQGSRAVSASFPPPPLFHFLFHLSPSLLFVHVVDRKRRGGKQFHVGRTRQRRRRRRQQQRRRENRTILGEPGLPAAVFVSCGESYLEMMPETQHIALILLVVYYRSASRSLMVLVPHLYINMLDTARVIEMPKLVP